MAMPRLPSRRTAPLRGSLAPLHIRRSGGGSRVSQRTDEHSYASLKHYWSLGAYGERGGQRIDPPAKAPGEGGSVLAQVRRDAEARGVTADCWN